MTSIVRRSLPLIAGLAFIVIWETAVRIMDVPAWLLPAPSKIWEGACQAFPLILEHTWTTLLETLLGLALAIILSIILSMLMDMLQAMRDALYPFFVVSQAIPLVIMAILFTIWFGWGITPKVLIVVLVCFFPLVVSLMQGMDGVDPDLIALMKSMGASPKQILYHVKLPSALPSFFAGLRIAASYSVMSAIVAEIMGAERGLGYYLLLTQKSFQMDKVLAAVAWICLISLAIVKTVDLAEYRALHWRRLHAE